MSHNDFFKAKKGVETPTVKIIPMSQVGAPTSGTWEQGDHIADLNGYTWTCTTAGTPGIWKSIVFPSVGDISTTLRDGSDYMSLFGSPTNITGMNITKNIDGTVTISSGDMVLRSGAFDYSPLINCHIDETILTIPEGTSFIYGTYNNGSPKLDWTDDAFTIELNDRMLVWVCTRVGTSIKALNGQLALVNGMAKLSRAALASRGYDHIYGSSVFVELSHLVPLTFYVSEGAFFLITNMAQHQAFNTIPAMFGGGGDTFQSVYRGAVAGTWNRTPATNFQLDNLHYDDGSGTLQLLPDNTYCVHFLYIILDNQLPTLMTLYGQYAYSTESEALAAQEPYSLPPAPNALPPECQRFATGQLIQKIIIKKGATSFTNTQDPFAKKLTSNKVLEHNGLANKQGGEVGLDEYYHASSAQIGQIHTQNTDTNTTSNTFSIGDGTDDSNKIIEANTVDSDKPFIQYDVNLNAWRYSNNGTVILDFDQRINQMNLVYVDKNGVDLTGDGTLSNPFLTITAALASITTNSLYNGFCIKVSPGVYVEMPLTMKTNVSIEGSGLSNTIIVCPVTTATAITIVPNTILSKIGVTGTTGTGGKLIHLQGGGDPTPASLNDVYFGDTETVISCDGSTGTGLLLLLACKFSSTWTTAFDISGGFAVAPMIVIMANSIIVHTNPTGAVPTFVNIHGAGSTFSITSCKALNTDYNGTGIFASDGASIENSGSGISGFNIGIHVDDNGAASSIKFLGDLQNVSKDILIENPLTTGTFIGNCQITKNTVDIGSTFSILASTESGSVFLKPMFQGDRYDRLMNLSKLVRETSTLGLVSGGTVSIDSGLTVSVLGGNGFVLDGTDAYIKELTWTTDTLLLAASSEKYVYINTNGVISSSDDLSDNLTTIPLARVKTDADGICMISYAPINATHYANRSENMIRTILGGIFGTGCVVSENGTTPRALNISEGRYYYGTTLFAPADQTAAVFEVYYKNGTGGYTSIEAQTVVENTQYDDGDGTLANLTPTWFVKHSFYINGDGTNQKHFLVLGQAQYATLAEAQAAATPIPPTHLKNAVVLIATIIVREGTSAIVEINNGVKPRIGGSVSGGTGGGVTAHGDLTGLGNDDHVGYLLANGNRNMSGSLNMGGNAITNVGNVDGVDVSGHAARHLPNSITDALTCAAPSTNVSGTSTNNAGIANSFARSDHNHAVSIGTTSGTLAAGDDSRFLTTADRSKIVDLTPYTSVRCASTGNVTISTGLNDGDVLDGITLATNDRVLLWQQTAPAENGIYIVGAVPARATDFNTEAEIKSAFIIVQQGAVNANCVFHNTNNSTITLESTLINFENFKDSENIELVTRNIYCATTGNDATGDGTVSNPFFSIHKAYSTIKPIVAVQINIMLADGDYDYSALPDLWLNKRSVYETSPRIYVINSGSTTASRYTTLQSGLTAASTTNGTARTVTGATFTVNEFKGNMMKVLTVKTGSVPTGDYIYVPIVANTADTIETGFVYSNYSNDVNTFDIVEHKTSVNFGTHYLNTQSLFNNIQIIDIELSAYSLRSPLVACTNSASDYPFYLSRVSLTVDRLNFSLGFRGLSTYINCKTTYNASNYLGFLYQCVYDLTTASLSAHLMSISNLIMDTYFYNSTGTATLTGITLTNTSVPPSVYGHIKFKGFSKAIVLSNTLNYSIGYGTTNANLYFDEVNYFIVSNQTSYGKYAKLIKSPASSVNFISEPNIARLTHDGVNAATEYYNTRTGNDFLSIAPAQYNVIKYDTHENTDVDSAAPEVVDSFSDLAAKAVRWDIVISKGSVFRTCSISAVWNSSTDVISDSGEYGIVLIGDSTDVTLSVDITTDLVRLMVTTISDNWSVTAQRYLI
jgi:hypothetical protein